MHHDIHFKQLIRPNFEAVLTLFFPAFAAQVNWTKGIEFLEREHSTDLPGNAWCFIGLGAKVTLCNGRSVVVHLMFRSGEDDVSHGEKVPDQVKICHDLLVLRHELSVVTIVMYLFRATKGLGWGQHRIHVRGMSEELTRYRVVGLPRLPARKGLRSGRSVGAALAALMDPGDWSRAHLKAECLRAVARTPDDAALKQLATKTIETYLPLEAVEEAEAW